MLYVVPLLWTLSLTLALVWRPDNAVGSLPRSVVVERCAALAVVTSGVVPAHTLAVDLPFKSADRKHMFEKCCCFFLTSLVQSKTWKED